MKSFLSCLWEAIASQAKWLYGLYAAVLLIFLGPTLISSESTLGVLMGVALLVAFVMWSYKIWDLGSSRGRDSK